MKKIQGKASHLKNKDSKSKYTFFSSQKLTRSRVRNHSSQDRPGLCCSGTSQGGMLESKLNKHTEVGSMVSGVDQRNPQKMFCQRKTPLVSVPTSFLDMNMIAGTSAANLNA